MGEQILTISFWDLIQIVSIVIAFFILAAFQKVILKEVYTTVIDAVYYKDVNKFFKTYIFRVVSIIFICLLYSFLSGFDVKHEVVYVGIGIAGFLQIWAAILNYHLLKFPISREKSSYLFFLILYLIACVVAVWMTFNLLFPIFRNEMEVFLFENTGVQVVFMLISFSFAGVFEYSLSKKEKRQDYISIESFKDETRILEDQINLEMNWLKRHKHEIRKYSEKNGVPEKLLYGIIMLEYLNRGSMVTRVIELIVCSVFPKLAINMDISVGVAQIKIMTASEAMEKSPDRLVKKLCNTDYNILVCSKVLKSIIEKFEQSYNDDLYRFVLIEYMGFDNQKDSRLLTLYAVTLESFCEIKEYENTFLE